MELGNKIRELRLKKSATQEQLAKQLHVSAQCVSKWETGPIPMPDRLSPLQMRFSKRTQTGTDKGRNVFCCSFYAVFLRTPGKLSPLTALTPVPVPRIQLPAGKEDTPQRWGTS